ncbi:MAG: hypothetical protein M3Y33_09155, partial [Actinomycetota bacterium]|nr:hypothetical protein [Actinomycetota bacterium]
MPAIVPAVPEVEHPGQAGRELAREIAAVIGGLIELAARAAPAQPLARPRDEYAGRRPAPAAPGHAAPATVSGARHRRHCQPDGRSQPGQPQHSGT